MIIGIDPGATGAIAFIHDLGDLIAVDDMPVIDRDVPGVLLAGLIRRHRDDTTRAVVERVAARPGQGVSSMFRFGRAVGVIDGVLGALSIPVDYVSPTVWKRALGLSADKSESRRRAVDEWPDHADRFARAKDDGRAEAALIALWAQRRRAT